MMIGMIKEPSYEEIRTNAKVAEDEHEVAYACWYPQMGGYVAKCVVITHKRADHGDGNPPCFEVLVWHDGDWPFSDNDGGGRAPRHIHHCSARQFSEFGNLVAKLQQEAVPPTGGS